MRDYRGRFTKTEESLFGKTIGLRLHKGYYPAFMELASQMGVTPAQLARTVIEEWVDSQREDEKKQ